ncbi:MAG: deoxyguanosinetriphosphate triphosphohydrolase [Eubacterium sp.]|nr:deoxyguanosinetriphosphate triphosphohydrolase [Eubacterium sp.]
MLVRQDLEKREYDLLSSRATRAAESKGRAVPEDDCDFRTVFQRDRDRIIHSKAFRRLMHKTQVFLSPEGDHYRTRLTHTLEVTQVARTISRALGLNEDLTEAIALGHDLGHTPFGHNGEAVLNDLYPGGFRHNEQSLRVVDVLESGIGRRGMNLTFEVRDGILNHTGSLPVATPEGAVVKISDRIAYINHDIDDAVRSGILKLGDLPESAMLCFGMTHSERISSMIGNVIQVSDSSDRVGMDEEHTEQLLLLRSFMFENVYMSPNVKKEEEINKVAQVIESLYNYYVRDPSRLPDDIQFVVEEEGPETAAKDHIAGMTDRFALNTYNGLFG